MTINFVSEIPNFFLFTLVFIHLNFENKKENFSFLNSMQSDHCNYYAIHLEKLRVSLYAIRVRAHTRLVFPLCNHIDIIAAVQANIVVKIMIQLVIYSQDDDVRLLSMW